MAELSSQEDGLRDTPAEKLDQECSNDDLNVISQSLTRWAAVSPWLGLTEADEEVVRVERDLERQRINVLRKWKAKQGEGATYRWVQEYQMSVLLCFYTSSLARHPLKKKKLFYGQRCSWGYAGMLAGPHFYGIAVTYDVDN